MAFSFNGNTPRKIIFNNQDVKKLIYNNDVVWEKKRLPVEYQEVEYIESTGTQYIDTGIASTRYITASLDMQFTEYSSSSMIIIAWSTGAGRWFGKGGLNTYSGGNDAVSDVDALLRKEIEVFFTPSTTGFTIDGVTYSKAVTSSKSTGYTMFAGRNVNTGVAFYASAKLYKATIQENGVTIRDFIPCYRKIDKKPGLYDAFNDVFYTNDGTGEFNVGTDIITIPTDYQKVEYIESTGTQYINTDVLVSTNNKIIMDLQFTDATYQQINGGYYIYRPSSTSYTVRNDIGVASTGMFFMGASTTSITTDVTADTNRHTFMVDATTGEWSIDDVSGSVPPATHSDYEVTLLIGARRGRNVSGRILAPATYCEEKIYNVKIYTSGNLVRDFIPCYRKIDNVLGLYDIVNDVFYTNAGSGEFTAGAEINALPTEYQRVEYIESSGTQYIQTSVTPNDNFRMNLKTYTTCGDSYYCAGVRASSKIWFGQTGTTTNNRVSASVNGTSVNASTDGVLWSRSTSGQTYEIMLCTNGDGTFTYHIKDLTNNKESLTENREYTLMGEATNGVCLFALNRNYIVAGTNQIYYFRLYKNGKIAFDGIPCYRKSDDVIGLYDLVSKQFYTNQGTGTFTKGPDVN